VARANVKENPAPVEVADAPDDSATTLGTPVEVGFDGKAEALRAAAMADWQAKQNPGEWVRLGNGAIVRAQPGIAPHYDINEEERKEANMLGRMAEMILPRYRKPAFLAQDGSLLGYRYRWLVFKSLDPKDSRPAETANLHRGNKIRYVEVPEIDDDCPFAVYTEHPAGDRSYVTHMSLILAEILDPRLAYMHFRAMEDKALDRLKSAPRDVSQSPSLGQVEGHNLITSVPGRAGMNFTGPQATRQGG
jgi:hypothetical protein